MFFFFGKSRILYVLHFVNSIDSFVEFFKIFAEFFRFYAEKKTTDFTCPSFSLGGLPPRLYVSLMEALLKSGNIKTAANTTLILFFFFILFVPFISHHIGWSAVQYLTYLVKGRKPHSFYFSVFQQRGIYHRQSKPLGQFCYRHFLFCHLHRQIKMYHFI